MIIYYVIFFIFLGGWRGWGREELHFIPSKKRRNSFPKRWAVNKAPTETNTTAQKSITASAQYIQYIYCLYIRLFSWA